MTQRNNLIRFVNKHLARVRSPAARNLMGSAKGFVERYFFSFPHFDRKELVFYILILIGLLRPLGYIINSRVVNGIGASTCISPLPTVFSSPGGIEAFTSQYLIVFNSGNSVNDTTAITPAMFSKLNESSPFKNAVALTFGYFPLLPDSTSQSLLRFFFFKQHILQEMGIPYQEHYTLINRNRNGEHPHEWTIRVSAIKE